MEITWLIIAALVLIAIAIAVLFLRARATGVELRSELEAAQNDLHDAQTALGASQNELRVVRDQAQRLESGAATAGDGAGDAGAPKTIIREAVTPETTGLEQEQEGAPRTRLYRPPVATEPEDSNAGLPYLRLSRDGGEDQLHYLKFGSVWAGRDPGNDIVIEDEASSRRHFEILFTENRFQLRDNESTNGTICNGSTIQQHWLEFGDEIKIGNTTMVFSCKGYDLKDSDALNAIVDLEKSIQRQPDFILALKILAFLLERDIARKSEATPLWDAIARLEK